MKQQTGSDPDTDKFQSAAHEAFQRYQQRAEELNEARCALSKISERIQALEQNAQAAQTEADTAKAAWTALLREGDGTLTKEVQRYRAAERSAYTLIEEYDVIREELQRQLDLKDVSVAELACKYENAYWDVLKTKADLALERAMARVGLELGVARRLHDKAARSPSEVVPLTPEILRDRFMASIERSLAGRSDEVSAMVASELDGIVLDLAAVNRGLMHSPLSRQQRLREHAASR